jgi:hypothetical protein
MNGSAARAATSRFSGGRFERRLARFSLVFPGRFGAGQRYFARKSGQNPENESVEREPRSTPRRRDSNERNANELGTLLAATFRRNGQASAHRLVRLVRASLGRTHPRSPRIFSVAEVAWPIAGLSEAVHGHRSRLADWCGRVSSWPSCDDATQRKRVFRKPVSLGAAPARLGRPRRLAIGGHQLLVARRAFSLRTVTACFVTGRVS